MILTLGSVRLLCVVGSYLACAVARAADAEAVAFAFEGVAKSIEGVGELYPAKAPPAIVQRVAHRQIRHIEEGCEKWLEQDLGPAWRNNADAASVLPALEHVLPACLPGSGGFAAEDLNPDRIVAAALVRAAAIDPKDRTFAPGGIGHNVLRCLLARSVAALEHDAEFRELLQLAGLRELLHRSREHDARLDAIAEADERRHRELLQAIARDKGIDPQVLAPLFDHLGHGSLTLDEMRRRAGDAIEAILARARQKVEPSNDGADIDATIGAARARLGNLDTAGARSILAAKIAEEEAARRQRLIPLLEEQAAIEELSYDHDAAKGTLRQLLALDPERVWSWIELGDILVTTGALDQAVDAYRRSLAIADRLAKADPGNAGWQRDLSVSHNKIGDVQQAQGNLPAALTSYQASHDIFDRLAKADPGNAGWQRDLALSYGRVAMVEARQGAHSDALGAFRQGRDIVARLTRQSPDNAILPKDLAWFNSQIEIHEG
jgi:tetratricopeptide (TPR) repeat protein